MVDSEWPEYIPPACEHPTRIKKGRLCDPYDTFMCPDCGEQWAELHVSLNLPDASTKEDQ